MDFEKGLTKTVEWYRENHGNWGDIDSALVAHPRRGHTVKEIQGSADPEADSNLQVRPPHTALSLSLQIVCSSLGVHVCVCFVTGHYGQASTSLTVHEASCHTQWRRSWRWSLVEGCCGFRPQK